MLDFINVGFTELWRTEIKRKIKKENICSHRDSNQQPYVPTASTWDNSAMLRLLVVPRITHFK